MTNWCIFPPNPPLGTKPREGSRKRRTSGVLSGRRLKAAFRVLASWLFLQSLPLCERATAATLTWTGAAGDNSIANRLNWSPAQAPLAGDTLIFAGATGLAPQLAANLSIAGLSFGSTAQAFVLGGAGIYTVGSGGIANGSTTAKTINNGIVLGASQAWNAASGSLAFGGAVNLQAFTLTVSGAQGTTITGVISGSGALVQNGPGTLALAGANTFTGGMTITAGTLQLNASAAFPTSGNLTMLGGTFDIHGTNPTVGLITFGNGTATTATSITDSGTTPGMLTLSGGIAYNGTSGFTFPPVLITAKIQLTPGIHSVTNPNGIYSAATAYDIVFSNTISGSGGFSKDGPSANFWIALNAQNTYSGVTNVTVGNLYLGAANAVPQFSALTVSSGATLILNPTVTQFGVTAGSYNQSVGSLAGAGSVTLGAATLTTGNDGTSTAFSGVVSGTGGFVKVGAGVQTLSGTNTFTGPTVISGGKVIVTGALGATAVSVAGGTSLGGSGNGTSTGIIGLTTSATGGTVTVAGGTNAATRGVIDLTDGAIGTLTIRGNSAGAGSVTLTIGGSAGNSSALNFDIGASTTDRLAVLQKMQVNVGGAIINLNPLAGTVLVPGTYPLITFAGDTLTGGYTLGSVTGNGGYSYALSHTATAENLIVLAVPTPATAYWNGAQGPQWTTFGAGTSLTNWSVTAAGTANTNQIPGAVTDVFFTIASGAANLTSTLGANFSVKSLNFTAGSGSATIGGANTLTIGAGGITGAAGAGAQTIATPVVLGAAQTWTNNGGTLTFSGATITGAGLNLTTAGAGNFAISAVVQTGAGSFTQTGSGTVTLSGTNNFTGGVIIRNGTVVLDSTTAAGSGAITLGDITGSAPASLIFSTTAGRTVSNAISVPAGSTGTRTIGGLNVAGVDTFSGAVALATGVTLTEPAGGEVNFTGVVSGAGGLTKTGAGTIRLTNANTFTGATLITAGTLAYGSNNALGTGSLTVNGGTLDMGNRTDSVGAVTLLNGSILGTGGATLTSTSGFTLSNGTVSAILAGAVGLTKDTAGTVTLSAANTFTGALNVNAGSVILSGATGTMANVASVSILTGASLVLDNSVTENANRISNTAAINIQGGNLQLNSDANGTAESVGQLNFLLGPANVTVAHNGTAAQGSSLTFSSIGSTVTGVTLNFAGTGLGGALGSGATGPHIYITGQANGLIGGWARVGSDFADYQPFGVVAFSAYYTGVLGVNVNDPSTIVKLTGTSAAAAYTLTNAGTTTDGGLLIAELALVDLGPSATRTLNLKTGGLIKKSAPDSIISGAGRLTAGGTVAGALQVAVETGRTLTISSAIIDNAGTDGVYGNAGDGVVSIVKSDLGTLTLSGANTFSGNVYLNDGTLAVGTDVALGAAANDVFMSGGTLAITAGFTPNTGRRFVVTSGLTSAMDVAAAQSFTITGASDLLATGNSASTLVKTGAGDIVLGAANPNFTGTARIAAGAVELRNTGALGTGGVTLAGGTLRLRSDVSATFGNAITVAADSTIAASPLTAGTPVITTGAVSIGAQILSLTPSGGASLVIPGVNLTGSATFNTSGGTTTMGAISGAYGFAKTGAGTLLLTTADTYSGVTDVQAGTLRITNVSAIPLASNLNVGAAGMADLNGLNVNLGSISGSGAITLGSGTLTVGGNGLASAFAGSISGIGGLVKIAGETLTLSGANTYTGATGILVGDLLIGATNALPTGTAVNIAAAGGLNLTTFAQQVASITGSGTLTIGTGALTVGDNTNTAFSGTIIGTGPLTKVGSGTWSLSGNSPYTGLVTVAGGIIEVLANNAIGDPIVMAGAQINLAPGVTVSTEPLTLAGTGSDGKGALQVITGAATWAGAINFSADASTGAGAGATLTLGDTIDLSDRVFTVSGAGNTVSTGVISGAGTLRKTDAGTLTLGGANTFAGTLAVNDGTVRLAASNTINGNPAVTLSSTATLDLNGFSDSLGSLSGAGTVTFGALSTGGNSLGVGSNGANTTFTGLITGSGSLAKTGTGTLVLASANSYTGSTTISAGTLVAGNNSAFGAGTQPLILNGGALASDSDTRTLANAITVNPVAGNQITGANSMTLTGGASGSGTLAVNLASNAKTLTVNPAAADSFAPGMVRLNSGTLLLGSSNRIGDTTDITFAGGRLDTGGYSDQLGALILAADSTLDFGTSNTSHLQFSSATWTGGTLSIANWTGVTETAGNPDQFLVTSSGPVDSGFLSQIRFQGYQSGAIAFDRGAGLYEIVPVPEPATIFGASALVAFVFWRERRRIGRVFRNGGSRGQER